MEARGINPTIDVKTSTAIPAELVVTTLDQEVSIPSRLLYEFIHQDSDEGKSQKNYARWINGKLLDNQNFVEGIDYTALQPDEDSLIRTKRQTYNLTFNTAKHLVQVSNTATSHAYRQYLIDVEQKYIADLKSKALPAHKSHYTIRDFMNYKGFKNLRHFDTSEVAYKLTRLCKRNGIAIEKKASQKWGTINQYPYEVLVMHFGG